MSSVAPTACCRPPLAGTELHLTGSAPGLEPRSCAARLEVVERRGAIAERASWLVPAALSLVTAIAALWTQGGMRATAPGPTPPVAGVGMDGRRVEALVVVRINPRRESVRGAQVVRMPRSSKLGRVAQRGDE